MLKKQRVILVEDEHLLRDELRHILCRHMDIEVVGEAETTAEGRRLIERGGVDGVFLDIVIESESERAGMELAYKINLLPDPPWIVFTTAYPEYALEAHAVHPVHYLLKPLDDAKVDKALSWMRSRISRSYPAQSASLPPIIEIKHRIPQNSGENRLAHAYADPITEILFVKTDQSNDTLKVHLLGCRDLERVAGPLKDWEERLAPYGFERIHNSCVANLRFCDGLEPHPIYNDVFQMTFTRGGCSHPQQVGRQYLSAVRNKFGRGN